MKWVKSRKSIGGFPTVELCSGNEHDGTGELALQLKRGEVHIHSSYLYGVSVFCHLAANRLISLLGLKRDKRKCGEELQFQMAREQTLLERVVKVLGGPRHRARDVIFKGDFSPKTREIGAKTGDCSPGQGTGHSSNKNPSGGKDGQ